MSTKNDDIIEALRLDINELEYLRNQLNSAEALFLDLGNGEGNPVVRRKAGNIRKVVKYVSGMIKGREKKLTFYENQER